MGVFITCRMVEPGPCPHQFILRGPGALRIKMFIDDITGVVLKRVGTIPGKPPKPVFRRIDNIKHDD